MFFDYESSVQFNYPVLTPDEIEELMLLLDEPVESPNSGSDEGSNRGWSGSTCNGSIDEERKRKRMISNRESARRSRVRKRRRLEELSGEADRLSQVNRELKNRVGIVANRCHMAQRENERLRFEYVALWARLSNLRRVFTAIHTTRNHE